MPCGNLWLGLTRRSQCVWLSCIHGAQQKSLTRDHRCSSHVLTSSLPRVGKQHELVDPTLKTIPKFHVLSQLHAFVNLFSTTMWSESRTSMSRHRDKKRGWLIVSDTATELCSDCDHGCHRPVTGTSIKKLSQFVGHFSRRRRRQKTAAALPKLLLLSRRAASSKRVAVSNEKNTQHVKSRQQKGMYNFAPIPSGIPVFDGT